MRGTAADRRPPATPVLAGFPPAGPVLVAVLAVAALLLTGCRSPVGGRPASPASTAPAGYGARFLAVGECSSFGTTSFTEVPCAGERAAARVVARYDGTTSDGPRCPPTTDFVLHIGAQRTSGTAGIPQGYACMRNLEPPHPGDPGRGGGPRTIAGDCVYGAGRGAVRETACDGSGHHRPQYKVTTATTTRARCPASTVLYVELGGAQPVGCARRIRAADRYAASPSSRTR
ncbi:hypothetical protein [Streptomyces sp. NPDC047028]|uniref:hypothetical protein n=1 Tax=Streptomyces sp. NPDC047028 TaxID=3155793 RepID=UPI0033DD8CA7